MSVPFDFRSERFESLKQKRIAVLFGGFGPEREVSLRSGDHVLRRLLGMGLQAFPIEVGPDFLTRFSQGSADVAYNILHGTFGEDGHIQGLLEFFKVAYTGEDLMNSSVCFHKIRTKEVLRANYLPTGDYFSLEGLPPSVDNALHLLELKSLRPPLMLKPFLGGSSLGIKKIHDDAELKTELQVIFENGTYERFYLEAFVAGREITVGLFRDGDEVRLLPILELKPKKEFYDYEAKYTPGMTEMILPAPLSKSLALKVELLARKIYSVFQFANCVRIDMILAGDQPIVLEINTQPGMTATSDIPAMLEAAGISVEYFLSAGLENALKRKKTLEN